MERKVKLHFGERVDRRDFIVQTWGSLMLDPFPPWPPDNGVPCKPRPPGGYYFDVILQDMEHLLAITLSSIIRLNQYFGTSK